MFFGITNSIVTFQTIINNIFQDLIVEDIMIIASMYYNVLVS